MYAVYKKDKGDWGFVGEMGEDTLFRDYAKFEWQTTNSSHILKPVAQGVYMTEDDALLVIDLFPFSELSGSSVERGKEHNKESFSDKCGS